MADNKKVNDLLYGIDRGIGPWELVPNENPDEIIIEALQMGLIFKSGYKYLLTKEGLNIVKSGKTYDDYLRERFASQDAYPPTKAVHTIRNHVGIGLIKKSWIVFIKLLNNDWVKFTTIGVLIAIFIYLLRLNAVR